MDNLLLFDDNPPPESKERRSRRNRSDGAHNATGRYKKLKESLDGNLIANGSWRDVDTRTAIKCDDAPNFVDLFSGAGGMSQGIRAAGFRKIFSNEIDPVASDTIQRNFADSLHFNCPIQDLTEEQVLGATEGKRIHLLAGGPPCQGFSVAGLRQPSDPRNQLFREYIRILRVLQPDYFIMENVPGILTMQNGAVAKEILRQLAESGYENTTVRILEAADFGIPQMRARAVFVGNRHRRMNPYPKPICAKQNYRSIETAIDDLKLVPFDPSSNHHGTRHSREMEKRLAKIPPGGSLYSTFRDAWKRQYRGVPSMTIKENHGGVHVHYELNRVLTAREMARLQTFPDSYIFSGSFKKAYWQIGNAVPCDLAMHLGRAILLDFMNIE